MQSVTTIDKYIALYPKEVQTQLQAMRNTIHAAAPHAEEAMRYGIPTFRLNGNLVHFGAFKSHIGFFPGPSGVAYFAKDLSKYATSKGTIRFPLEKPLPHTLIKRIVKFRVLQQTTN